MKAAGCPLCDAAGGHVVFQGDKFRLVRADEKGYPAFYRLVWADHVREFSDLAPGDRAACMDAVVAVEEVLRGRLQPEKVNLATLGNVVPHLHWHVIARFDWDPAWPAPVWSAVQREPDSARMAQVEMLRPALEEALHATLAGGRGICTAS